jgi:glycosyltransferase involved in cell wall biosynthesis
MKNSVSQPIAEGCINPSLMMINLSYVISTYNKLPYLKVIIYDLLLSVHEDEEIIIIDGGSTDGTKEYIEDLYKNGKISLFLSESDKGEAHGFNKGILFSKGNLIKIISDDDTFFYPAINACKQYMLSHTGIDVMAGNTASLTINDKNSIYWEEDFYLDFVQWKEGLLKHFFFNGTCIMIRKSSLPLLGLVNSNNLLADMEYTLRMTGIAKLAWCSAIVSVRILNPQSNNLIFKERAKEEAIRLCQYYNYSYPWERRKKELKQRSLFKKSKIYLFRLLQRFFAKNSKTNSVAKIPFSDFKEAHIYSENWLINHPKNQNILFFGKD